jgi:uncharacterized protein YjfI (DUF2170 family)
MPAPELSQHLLQAHVSMILVSLPLPPLPVLVIRGEDHTTSFCSSHDLHAAMISTHLHMTSTGAAGDEAVQKHNIEAKQEVLHTMMAALNTAWTKTRALPVDLEEQDKQLLTEAYVLFANAFRDYCSHYVHSCRDMRVMPMSHVDIGDATHRSAAEYVSAYMHGDGASASDNKDLPYSNLLRKWLYYIMSPELSGNYTTSPVLSGWDVESPAPELTRDETTLPDLYCTPDYSPEEPDEA